MIPLDTPSFRTYSEIPDFLRSSQAPDSMHLALSPSQAEKKIPSLSIPPLWVRVLVGDHEGQAGIGMYEGERGEDGEGQHRSSLFFSAPGEIASITHRTWTGGDGAWFQVLYILDLI